MLIVYVCWIFRFGKYVCWKNVLCVLDKGMCVGIVCVFAKKIIGVLEKVLCVLEKLCVFEEFGLCVLESVLCVLELFICVLEKLCVLDMCVIAVCFLSVLEII